MSSFKYAMYIEYTWGIIISKNLCQNFRMNAFADVYGAVMSKEYNYQLQQICGDNSWQKMERKKKKKSVLLFSLLQKLTAERWSLLFLMKSLYTIW